MFVRLGREQEQDRYLLGRGFVAERLGALLKPLGSPFGEQCVRHALPSSASKEGLPEKGRHSLVFCDRILASRSANPSVLQKPAPVGLSELSCCPDRGSPA